MYLWVAGVPMHLLHAVQVQPVVTMVAGLPRPIMAAVAAAHQMCAQVEPLWEIELWLPVVAVEPALTPGGGAAAEVCIRMRREVGTEEILLANMVMQIMVTHLWDGELGGARAG